MIMNPDVEVYCKAHTKAESALLQELREYTQAKVSGAQMLSDILVGRLLQFLVLQLKPRLALDLGTFTGYSALSIAEVLPEAGVVITCDKSKEHLSIAESFFNKSEFGHKIQICEGEIMTCINAIDQQIDFAFIDADKMRLLEYVNAIYPLLKIGGMIVIDNVLWNGEVLQPTEKRAQAIAHLNQAIVNDPRFTNVLLPIRDGLNIMCKL